MNGDDVKPIVFVDGNFLAYKSFFVYEDFDKAVKIFLSTTWKLKQKTNARNIVVVFDHERRENFRYSYSWYKKTRQGKKHRTNETYLRFLKDVQPLLKKRGLVVKSSPYYEADDIIGIEKQSYAKKKIPVVIYTGDKDLLQLVDQYTEVWYPEVGHTRKIKKYNDNNFKALNDGFEPYQIAELKGLVGDRSDSIPGAKNIHKSVSEGLVKKYGSIDNIFANLDEIKDKDPILAEKLSSREKIIYISLEVGTIMIKKQYQKPNTKA